MGRRAQGTRRRVTKKSLFPLCLKPLDIYLIPRDFVPQGSAGWTFSISLSEPVFWQSVNQTEFMVLVAERNGIGKSEAEILPVDTQVGKEVE